LPGADDLLYQKINFEEALELVDQSFALCLDLEGVFSQDRYAVEMATKKLKNAAGQISNIKLIKQQRDSWSAAIRRSKSFRNE